MARREKEAKGEGNSESQTGIDLACRIQTDLDSMSEVNRRIAAYLLRHPRGIASATITGLARKIRTSSSAITRFCQRLGYSGFAQFKYSFDKSSMSTLLAKQSLAEGDSIPAIKEKLFHFYQRCVEETLYCMDISVLERISDLVVSAGKIFIFGQFGNGVSARMGEALFMQVGMPAFAYTDISLATVAAAQLRKNDLAIGISSTGRAKTPVDAIRVAKAAGATTVGITGFADSLLARECDILLRYNLGVEDVRLVHLDRLCEIMILGVIQNCVIRKNYSLVAKGIKLSRDAFLGARYPKGN